MFVNATGTAAPFEEHLGALDTLVAPYAPERLVRRRRHTYEIAANWKIVCENYHECYHCPLIHPELCQVSPPTSGDNYDLPGAWVGGAMDLAEDAVTMSLDGHSDGLFLDGVDPRKVLYLGLFPNLLVSAHPDYVMTHRLVPLAPDRTWVECSWYFASSERRPGVRGGLLGPDEQAGLRRLRVGAARAGLAALPAGAVRPQRGRRAQVGEPGRPRLPGHARPPAGLTRPV